MKLNYWLSPDLHLGHDMLWKENIRPKDFEWKIHSNHINMIKSEDIWICLGDFSFYRNEFWHKIFLQDIVCKKKWLILGNHDKKSMTWYLNMGWDFVGKEIKLNMFGYNILLSHKPIFDGYFNINIHGHLHEGVHRPKKLIENSERNILLSMEHNYSPFNLRHVVEHQNKYR